MERRDLENLVIDLDRRVKALEGKSDAVEEAVEQVVRKRTKKRDVQDNE